MKIKLNPSDIGLEFAEASDEEQAAIFNEMGRAFQMMSKNNPRMLDTQVCFMADKLDANGSWLVKELAGYVDLRKGLNQ